MDFIILNTMKRILIVEDDKVLSKILVDKFRKEGYEVTLAMDGKEALMKVGEATPDLIVLDILLPEVSGLDVLEQIRKTPGLQALPVLMLTNMPESAVYQRARNLGVTEYLVKTEHTPSQICELVKLILEEEEKVN